MPAPRTPRPAICVALLLVAACDRPAPPDAYGNFEAEEVVVAAETAGRIGRLDVIEGRTLPVDAVVGLIDTTQLALERDQLAAQRTALDAARREAELQRAALDAQYEIAERVWARTQRLYAAAAATAAQRDQAERDRRVLGSQAAAARAGIERAAAERAALDARLAALADRLRRATLRNPTAGTVLVTYARAGEYIQPGQPLYRIADLDTLVLRAYVDGTQLAGTRLGAAVDVHVDTRDGIGGARTGTIAWISSRGEFTPTQVQTRDDRTDLVYAVKIRVANPDGTLKVGMPADVLFRSTAPATTTADRR
ncbi:MAG: efflux RND transporter periplasmic adaptor subunit [Gemmatimonadaceae bacterium]|nr:efflux RND transporter periplasmic adaptor subunit [Gemmatimonadaceae bacterium]